MRRAIYSAAILALIPAFAFAAQPGIPELVYGSAPGADGTTVNALIAGQIVASTTLLGGSYGYSPHLLLIPDAQASRAGASISFTLGGAPANESTAFNNGAITRLDLTLPASAKEAAPIVPVVPAPPITSGITGTLAPPQKFSYPINYDLNGDHAVNLSDVEYMFAHWGQAFHSSSDLNTDGVVDVYDFNLLVFKLLP